jgi:hypothetical protein
LQGTGETNAVKNLVQKTGNGSIGNKKRNSFLKMENGFKASSIKQELK